MPAKLRLVLCSLAALSLSYVAVRHVAVYASSFTAPVEGPGSSTSTMSMSKTVRSIRYATSSVDRMTHQSDQGYPKAPAGA
jgi:hypothetical protein